MSGPANCVSQKTFELYVTASGFSKPWSPESRDLFWFYGKGELSIVNDGNLEKCNGKPERDIEIEICLALEHRRTADCGHLKHHQHKHTSQHSTFQSLFSMDLQ